MTGPLPGSEDLSSCPSGAALKSCPGFRLPVKSAELPSRLHGNLAPPAHPASFSPLPQGWALVPQLLKPKHLSPCSAAGAATAVRKPALRS